MAPLWVTAAKAGSGPKVQVGATQVPQGGTRGSALVQMKQLWGSTSHSHRSPQDTKVCPGEVRGRQRKHPQDPCAEQDLGKGLVQGRFAMEQGELGRFLAVTAAAKSQQIGGEWDT